MVASPVREDAGPDLRPGVTLADFGEKKPMLRGTQAKARCCAIA